MTPTGIPTTLDASALAIQLTGAHRLATRVSGSGKARHDVAQDGGSRPADVVDAPAMRTSAGAMLRAAPASRSAAR